MALGTGYAWAQGCVAAHSTQRPFDELISTHLSKDTLPGTNGSVKAGMPDAAPRWEDNLTVDIGYRVFNSNKYFQGSTEIPRASAVENHQNIFDVGVEYRLSPRWSLIADVPVFNGSRDQIYPPTGIFRVSGVGDITVGVQQWFFRPPTENGSNISWNSAVEDSVGKRQCDRSGDVEGADGAGNRRPVIAGRRWNMGLQPRFAGVQNALAFGIALRAGELSVQPGGYERSGLVSFAAGAKH